MKNRIITFLILFISGLTLSGQIQKKTLMVGGSVDLHLETRSPVGFGFMIHPSFGYFPARNFAIGLQLDADFSIRDGSHYTSLGIGPMIRYYIGNESLSVFGHFAYLAIVDFNSQSTETSFSNIIIPGVGINYMILPTIGLEGLLGMYLGQVEPTVSFSLGFQIFIPPSGN